MTSVFRKAEVLLPYSRAIGINTFLHKHAIWRNREPRQNIFKRASKKTSTDTEWNDCLPLSIWDLIVGQPQSRRGLGTAWSSEWRAPPWLTERWRPSGRSVWSTHGSSWKASILKILKNFNFLKILNLFKFFKASFFLNFDPLYQTLFWTSFRYDPQLKVGRAFEFFSNYSQVSLQNFSSFCKKSWSFFREFLEFIKKCRIILKIPGI